MLSNYMLLICNLRPESLELDDIDVISSDKGNPRECREVDGFIEAAHSIRIV